MDFRRDLNEEQLNGVTCTSQYTKVIAGAGSGKTRVLTYRIAYLLEQRGVSPWEILGITFTNKAAQEIKERVNKLCPGAEGMALSTIHSYCARFLRRYCSYIHYPSNFTILDDEDQLKVFKEIFARHNYPKNDPKIKECLNWVCSKKTEGYQYKDLKDNYYSQRDLNLFLKFFGEYEEILRKTARLDFDDLLLKTIEILEEDNGIRDVVSRKFKHILVDEFQDINDVQFYFITLMMNRDTNLYVVGDPDQTIYTWRGANNHIMINLERKIASKYLGVKVETIILKNNYRSSANILKCANKLIEHNIERIKKELNPVNGDGEQVSFFNSRTQGDESAYIATIIKDDIKKGNEYSQYAVLYRSNYLTRELESQLSLHGIPYKIFGGVKFYQRKEIKDIIAYLTIIMNPLDDTSLERVINVPKRNIGPTTVDLLKSQADEAGQSLYYFIKENLGNIKIPKTKKDALIKLIYDIDITRDAIECAENKDYGDIIENFLARIGYKQYLHKEEDGDDRIENVNELIGTFRYFYSTNTTATFEDFIINAALQASSDEVNEGNYVSLMTVHMAKGLEFDKVFIYGFNDGVFPSQRAIDESSNAEEEERRLAYVAITRARKKLYITCNQDYSYVRGGFLRPSRFIKEAGLETKKTNDGAFMKRDTYINPYNNSSYRKKETVTPVSTQTNGITSWEVGDNLIHEQFGRGTVIEKSVNKIIKVKFDNPEHGTKSLLSTHIKIRKIYS